MFLTPLLFLALAAPPRLLIAPLAPAKKGGPVPSASLANHLAQEMDDDGRTSPIVWGLSDPVFRPLALEGRLGDVPDLPERDAALDVARKLDADYVLLYRSERKAGRLDASAELVQNGRTVWKDQKSMNAKLGDAQSDDDTAASIARTWMLLLTNKDGPLKSLPSRKTAVTPDATPGQNPVIVTSPPPSLPPAVTTDLAALDARLADLLRAGRTDQALMLARDAVDADPLSPGPRTTLVRLLASQGDAAGAADEALRAADLLPDQPALRLDAVRRLLALGRTKEARTEANELRARTPDDPAARRLSAEVALAGDDAETAVREMEALLKLGDDPEARLLRGIGRARLGGAEGAEADLRAWAAATPAGPARADGYAFAERSLGSMAERAAATLPALLQRAAAQPKSGAVRDELDEAQRQSQARAAAFAALPVEGSVARHDAWALAHRLMALVAADLRAFLAGGDDALTSARLDLGEAKRAMKTAREGIPNGPPTPRS